MAESAASIGRRGSREKAGKAGRRLVGFGGIERVEDGADQERMAGFLSMVPPLQRPFRIYHDVRDILDVTHFGVAAADLSGL